MGRSVLTRLSPFVTRLSRADEIKHLRNALLAEFDGLLATTVDDDAGHAHRAIMVPKLGEVRNIVGLGAHGETRIMILSGLAMDFARSIRSSPNG